MSALELGHAPFLSSPPPRSVFIRSVYSTLTFALSLTLANTLLALLFLSLSLANAVAVACVVYLTLGMTLFFTLAVSYISLRTDLDFTVHKLFLWTVELLWLFVFVGLWMFTDDSYRELLVLWATLGLVVLLLQLAVHTQMVSGGLARQYTHQQTLLAPLSLFWDILLIFLLALPIMGSVVNSLLDLLNPIEED